MDLFLNRFGEEQVGLAVGQPVRLVELDLARVIYGDGGPTHQHRCKRRARGDWRLAVEERPQDRVREAVIVPLGNFCREVDGNAGELGLELLRDEIAINLRNVETCVRWG
jgi:hypothetical protein